MAAIEFALEALASFDFEKTAMIFSCGSPDIRTFKDGVFTQAIVTGGGPVLIAVRSGGAHHGKASGYALSVRAITGEDKGKTGSPRFLDEDSIKNVIRRIFSLGMDIEIFYREVKNDRILSAIAEQLRGMHCTFAPTVHEALVSSIIEQQISIKAAHSVQERLVRAFGRQLAVDGCTYYAFPEPIALAGADIRHIHRCGLSGRKAEYIKDLSVLIAGGGLDLDRLEKKGSTGDIIKELCRLRGIGPWTAEFTVIRGMQRLDAFPADDLGVRRCISKYYRNGLEISPPEARKIATEWGRWKGLAAYYLLRAEALGVSVTDGIEKGRRLNDVRKKSK